MIKTLSLFFIFLVFIGCAAKEPEGPGEQIGKGIDLITKGLGGLDAQSPTESKLEREAREKEKERLRRQNYNDSKGDLGHDPYYDTPPSSYDTPPSSLDDSDRRY